MHTRSTLHPTRRSSAPLIILLLIVLLQASWSMYSNITEFEVDIDHGRSAPWLNLILGLMAGCEVFGVFLILARHQAGFIVAIPAELCRGALAILISPSIDSAVIIFTTMNTIILYYLLFSSYTMLDDADTRAAEQPPDAIPSRPARQEGRTENLDAFLSYSRKQFYFAESLMLRLERRRVSVWFDTHRIHAGADWRKSIDQGLAACTSLVLIASHEALASKDVNYEWTTALEYGKRIYIVLFEAVELPSELSKEAVVIIDMRTRFEPKAKKLAELLTQPRRYHDRIPAVKPLRLPLRQPLSVSFIMVVLIMILSASLFFDIFNAQVLMAITTSNSSAIPEEIVTSFTTDLFGLTFHGLSSKVYAFLGICLLTLLLTALTIFLLVTIVYRRRFIFTLLALEFLGSSLLYLNTSFINHSTNHAVVSFTDNILSTPSNLNSSAWRDLDDMLLGQYVEYLAFSSPSDNGSSSFLSVGDTGTYFATTSANLRWPTLLLLVLAISALWVTQHSGSLFRRLATGGATERLRIRRNADREPGRRVRQDSFEDVTDSQQHAKVPPPETSGKQTRLWHLLYHPADGHIAEEIEGALARQLRSPREDVGQHSVSIVLLTNHTQLTWLENLEQEDADMICVICTNIQPHETLELLHRHQWFDYRERSYEKLTLLAKSLEEKPSENSGYTFPALPESLERIVVPPSVWLKSHAMRIFATWLLAMTLFGKGEEFSSFILADGVGKLIPVLIKLLFWICIPCSLYLFWLSIKLMSSSIPYGVFYRRLNTVMIILCITQLQFLLMFDNQLSLVMLGALINTLLAIAWFTPDASQIREWLPVQKWPPAEEGPATGNAGTLAIPLRRQLALSSLVYLALFAFFYSSGVIFFADLA